jgi:hypothetical protein
LSLTFGKAIITPRCNRPSDRRKPAILRVALHPIAGNKWDAGLELLREASPSSFEEMTTLYNTCGAQSVEFCQEAIAAKTVNAVRQTETTPTKNRHKSELPQ